MSIPKDILKIPRPMLVRRVKAYLKSMVFIMSISIITSTM